MKQYLQKLNKHTFISYASLCLIFYLLSIRLLLIFSYTLDIDGAEFTFVHYIQQVLSGKPLYLNPYEVPFSITIYSPLYLMLVAKFCAAFQINYIYDVHSIFIVGRLFSFIFSVIGAIFIFKFSVRYLSKSMALFCTSMYLMLLSGHSYAVRPDSMKIAFFIIFLFYFLDTVIEKNKQSKWLALTFLLLSIASKQDAFIYILLVQWIFVLMYRNKQIILFFLYSLLSIILFFGLFYLIYGKLALDSITLFNLQVITTFKLNYNYFVIAFNLVRLFPFIALFFFVVVRLKNEKLMFTLAIIGIIATILSSMSMLRPGSFINYSYELIVISIFLFVLFLKNNIPILNKIKLPIFFYCLFLFASNAFMRVNVIYIKNEIQYKEAYYSNYEMRKHVSPIIKEKTLFNPDLQLSLFFADKNVIFGHEFHLDRTMYALLGLPCHSKLSHVSSQKYDACFNDGTITYMLIKNNKTSNEVMRTYYADYQSIYFDKNYKLYKRKSTIVSF